MSKCTGLGNRKLFSKLIISIYIPTSFMWEDLLVANSYFFLVKTVFIVPHSWKIHSLWTQLYIDSYYLLHNEYFITLYSSFHCCRSESSCHSNNCSYVSNLYFTIVISTVTSLFLICTSLLLCKMGVWFSWSYWFITVNSSKIFRHFLLKYNSYSFVINSHSRIRLDILWISLLCLTTSFLYFPSF